MGPGKKSRGAPRRGGEKIFDFFLFKVAHFGYFIFSSDGGALKRRRAWGNIAPSYPISTGLYTSGFVPVIRGCRCTKVMASLYTVLVSFDKTPQT